MYGMLLRMLWRKVVLALLLVVLAAGSAVAGICNGLHASQDLQWQPVGRILQRENPYTPILDGTADTFLEQIPNYPVSGYAFLLPLGLFDWEMAKLIWVACNIIFTILLITGLQKLFPLGRENLCLTLALFIAGSSWRVTVGNGQHGLFVLAFFVWAVVYIQKRPTLSAFFLAISLFKYTITAPLAIYFVWKRQWQALLTAIIIHVFLTGIMALWLHENPLTLIRQPFQVAAMATTIGDYDIFSISRAIGSGELIPAVLSLITLLALTIVGAKYISPLHNLRAISILALTAYIVFFHRSYDLILLIFPLWLIMQPFPNSYQIKGDRSPHLWGGLRGGWVIALLVILAWHGRRLFLLLLTLLPETVADPLYTILLTTLFFIHIAALFVLVTTKNHTDN